MKAERVITTIDNGLMVTIAIRGGVVAAYVSREAPSGHYEHIGTFTGEKFVPDGKAKPTASEEEATKAIENLKMLAGALKITP